MRFNSKILYTLLIAVSGFVLTIGAASAVVLYSENIELDNGAGDSSIKVTSSTGDSKLILEDQGKRTWSITTNDGKRWLQIVDETSGKPFVTIKPNGKVGIGIQNAKEKLDVNGNVRIRMDANVWGNLNVDGSITGSFIQGLLATIAANEATIATNQVTIADLLLRISSLEAGTDTTVPMLSMVSDHGIMIDANLDAIAINAIDIETNREDIAEGGGGPNPCNPNGDSIITPQEVVDFLAANGFTIGVGDAEFRINISEVNAGFIPNGILNNGIEVAQMNVDFFIPVLGFSCNYP